jgi:hypothetical protein
VAFVFAPRNAKTRTYHNSITIQRRLTPLRPSRLGSYFLDDPNFQFCTFGSATIHRRFGIFRLGANYSLSNVSCGDAEKVLRTGEQSGDKSPQSKKMQNSN